MAFDIFNVNPQIQQQALQQENQARATPAPAPTIDPNAGQPTSFFARIAQVGMGKIAQLKLTAQMDMAAHTHNPTAFANASKANDQNTAQINSNVKNLQTSGNALERGVVKAVPKVGGFVKNLAVSTGKAVKDTTDFTNPVVQGTTTVMNNKLNQAISKIKSDPNIPNAQKQTAINKLTGQKNDISNQVYGFNATDSVAKKAEKVVGNAVQTGSLLLPGGGKLADMGGQFLLEKLGTTGISQLAEKAGIAVANDSVETIAKVADQIAKTATGKQAVKALAKEGTTFVSRALKASVKSGAVTGLFSGGQAMSQGGTSKQVAESTGQGVGIGMVAGAGGSLFKSALTKTLSRYNKSSTAVTDIQAMATKHGATEKMANERGLPTGSTQQTKLLNAGKSQPKGLPEGKGAPTVKGGETMATQSGNAPKVAQLELQHQQTLGKLDTEFNQVMKQVSKSDHVVTKTPVEGYTSTRQLQTDLADTLKQQESGLKGGQKVKTADGGYVRTTEHSPFYSQIFKATGKAPTAQDYQVEALRQLKAGKAQVGMGDVYTKLKAQAAKEIDQRYTQKLADVNTAHDTAVKEATAPVEKGFSIKGTQTPEAKAATARVSQLDTILSAARENGTTKSASELRGLMRERNSLVDVASGKKTVGTNQLKGATKSANEITYAEANKGETTSISQPVSRPTVVKEKTPPESVVDTNKAPSKGLSGLVSKAAGKLNLRGKLNPEQALAASGNTDAAEVLRRGAIRNVQADEKGYNAGTEFSNLRNGEGTIGNALGKTASDMHYANEIESGTGNQASHQYFRDTTETTGKRAADAGVISTPKGRNYFPHYGKFNDVNKSSVVGLRKTGGFTTGRLQAGEFGEGGDKYKTLDEFKTAVESNGGKVATDPAAVLQHTVATREKAIGNAQTLNELEHTQMADHNPAVITIGNKGLPAKYSNYDTSLLPGRAVHPDMVDGIKALSSSASDNSLARGAARVNSVVKRLVTWNGMVHDKNFVLGSSRKQGAFNTIKALFQLKKDFSKADTDRAISYGWVPFRDATTNIFDEANKGNGALGAAMGPLGSLRNKMDQVTFQGFGNHLSMSTFLNTEKKALKAGLSPDEAGFVAARASKAVSFMGSSSEVSSTYRSVSRLVAFAGQYFKSTLKEGATALGANRDNTLSSMAQSYEQKQAAKSLARGFGYLFAAAQAINIATTGHPTWGNKDSKISPVVYLDKSTGQEYHITNFYGQIGDLLHLSNPQELVNKSSPLLQEGSKVIANNDPYTGKAIRNTSASGIRQTAQIFANSLENFATPLGVQTSQASQLRANPAPVTGLKFLGFSTSTSDRNQLEKDIASRSGAAIPANAPLPSPQLQKLEATARQDITHGNKNSTAVQQVKSSMDSTQFKAFMKTGADNTTQREFDKLPTEQKVQIINKYSTQQLSELDLSSLAKTLVGSNARASWNALNQKGISDQQILSTLQKAGYGKSQLDTLKTSVKKQAAITRKTAPKLPKFVIPGT